MKLVAAAIVCSALLVGLLWIRLGPGPERSDLEFAADASSPTRAVHPTGADLRAPDATARIAQRTTASRAAPSGGRNAAPDAPTDLRSTLAAIGLADARRNEAELAVRLPHVVGLAERLLATSELLESAQLDAIPNARRGAIVALSVGVARWSRGGGPADRDGVSWTTELLVRMPRLDEDARLELANRIAGMEVAGQSALDERYVTVLFDLCRDDPASAATYVVLLARIADEPEEFRPHIPLLHSILADAGSADGSAEDESSAELRALALRVLFELEPASALAAALDLVKTARTNANLRGSLAAAIARYAPPEQAVELLLELHDPTQFGALAELAGRPGAGAALRENYDRLVTTGADPIGRRILVAGMRGEDPSLLFDIAVTDPSLEVRQQAFVTGTLRADEDPRAVSMLRTAYERRTDPTLGVPARGIVVAADNVVLNSRGPRRDAALALMEEIARDDANELSDRLFALRRLRPYVAAESIADLDGLGDPPEDPRSRSPRPFRDPARGIRR